MITMKPNVETLTSDYQIPLSLCAVCGKRSPVISGVGSMPGILFYADAEGDFRPLLEATEESLPAHVVLVGSLGLMQPLSAELADLISAGIGIHWLYGNQEVVSDTHSGLHAQARWMSGCRVVGLGGCYRLEVWQPRYTAVLCHMRAEYLAHMRSLGRCMDGLPALHRLAIFPEDHEGVRAHHSADILVSYEAPSSMESAGYTAIDDLAADVQAGLVVHGGHGRSYVGRTRDGVLVRGLGWQEPWLLR